MPLYQRLASHGNRPELRMSAQRNTAKRKRAKWGTSKKPLNTPPSKQALVVGLSLSGKKRSAISRELGLDRETVTRILSQQENQLLLQGYRQAVLRIVPNALIGHAPQVCGRQEIRPLVPDLNRRPTPTGKHAPRQFASDT